MKKNKQKIFSPDWLEFHPYKNSASTDLYYVQLCNRVLDIVNETLEQVSDEDYLFLSDEEKKNLSCILTAYFEDIISQSNIWNAFVKESNAQTGKWLPFLDTAEYNEDEINEADLQFLVWHYMAQLNQGQIAISPEEPLLRKIAEAVYPIFDEEYETAPENTKLKEFFEINEEEGNLYEIQSKFFWLGTESYLFFFNSKDLERELEDVAEVAKENQIEDRLMEMANMVMTDFSFNNVTEFFGLTSAQWLAKILGEENGLYEPLMNMSLKKSGYFIFQEQDSMYAQFRHVATGEILNVTNRSLVGFPKELKSSEVVVFAGFVEWQGEWWFIGDLRGYDVTEDLLAEIAGREEEINLFTEEEDENLASFDEQMEAARLFLVASKEEYPEEEDLDLNWGLLYNEDLTTDFLKEAMFSDAFPELRFPGEKGAEMMKNDFPFALNYFRRRG